MNVRELVMALIQLPMDSEVGVINDAPAPDPEAEENAVYEVTGVEYDDMADIPVTIVFNPRES
jgi:hypothetical protein